VWQNAEMTGYTFTYTLFKKIFFFFSAAKKRSKKVPPPTRNLKISSFLLFSQNALLKI
jgi:hypothetical protein